MMAVKKRDMTAKKNVIFSLVRTTLADCQVELSLVIRWETYKKK